MDMLTLVRRRCGTFVRQIDVFAVNLAQCTQGGFYHFYDEELLQESCTVFISILQYHSEFSMCKSKKALELEYNLQLVK